MKQKIYKIFSIFFKNTLVFLAGGLSGVFVVIIFAEPLLKYTISKDVGLGIIVLAPVILIICSLVFGTMGGILGIIIYNLFRAYKRKW